jgi:hypothetical protein
MAKWVSQAKTSSISKSGRARVAYLGEIVPEVKRLIRASLDEQPDGAEVTLDVLQGLGRDVLVRLGGGEQSLDRVKQDVGRLVAMCLVDMYEAHRVLTYREDDERAVSTRAVRRPGMEWVARFTPHRVLREGRADRIVLDTSVVRHIVQGGAAKNVLDVVELARVKGAHPISIADAAWAEIVNALLRPDGGISFTVWGRKAAEIDAVLDPDLPIVPSGSEMVALSGLSSPHGFDRAALAAWFQAVWRHTAGATSATDLATPHEYDGPDGSRYRIGPLDEMRPQEEILKRGESWRAYVERIAAFREQLTPDDAAALMRANLGLTLPAAVLDRLDLLLRVVAAYSARAGDPEHPYAADTNDAMDMDILFSTVLPAVVVTTDKRMRNVARTCGSADGWRVMFPGELLDWLGAESSTAQGPSGAKR